MNSKQIPPGLPRRRTSAFDDGPIAIYQPGGSVQRSEGGLSVAVIASIVAVVSCVGAFTIYQLRVPASAAGSVVEATAAEVSTQPKPAAEQPAAQEATTPAADVDPPAQKVTTASASATADRLRADGLGRDNPRWTVGAAQPGDAAAAAIKSLASEYREDGTRAAEPEETMAFAARPSAPDRGPQPARRDDGTDVEEDAAETASIPPAAEPRAAAPAKATRTARVNSAVNMRAHPRQGASVLTVIPAGADVGIVDCDLWCHVVHDGRSGYIYKDFVQRQGKGRARMTAEPVSARAAAPAEPSDEPTAAPAAPDAAEEASKTPLAPNVAAGNRGR